MWSGSNGFVTYFFRAKLYRDDDDDDDDDNEEEEKEEGYNRRKTKATITDESSKTRDVRRVNEIGIRQLSSLFEKERERKIFF